MRNENIKISRLVLLCVAGLHYSATHAQGEQAIADQTSADQTSTDQASFDIWEYRVLGNSILPSASIEQIVYSHLGPGKSIKDVEAARSALERGYRDAGYGAVFVDIPEQAVEGGTVRLRVTESRVDRVRITGARYFSNGRIRAALTALSPGQSPHFPHLQAQLAELNQQTADRAIVPVLKAGRTPGTLDVELKVDDTLPVHGSLEINDRYSADTSRLRMSGSLSYMNLFQRQHAFSLQYQTAPEEPDDVRAIVGSYVFRTDALPRTAFALYAVDSTTDVATLGALAVLGEGQIFGARAIQTLTGGSTWSHNVTYGLDFKDFSENIRLDEGAELVTPIQYLSWSVVYAANAFQPSYRSNYSVAAHFGLREVANNEAEFADKRFKGDPNFFYVRASMEQLYRLSSHLHLFGRLSGQFTQTPLVSNEQFALGGADTVRGYLESTQLGDYGANLSFELRNATLFKRLSVSPDSAYIAAFFDAGVAAILDPLPSQHSKFELASAGVGLRLSDWRGFDLAFDWARALRDAGRISAGDDRTHFSFSYGF